MIPDVVQLEVRILQVPAAGRLEPLPTVQNTVCSNDENLAPVESKRHLRIRVRDARAQFTISMIKTLRARIVRIDRLH